MNIEHLAFNVEDPTSLAKWYGEHLGMRIVRHVGGPTQTHFLGDESGRVVLEFYRHTKAAIPDYRAMEPLVLHIAFLVDDIAATRQRLLDAGAAAAGDIATTDAGDQLVFLRDPWGLALQLVKRATPLGSGARA